MKPLKNKKYRLYAFAVSTAFLALTAWYTLEPCTPKSERKELASKFKFERQTLTGPTRKWDPSQSLYSPPFKRPEGWISAFLPTGAMFADFDGEGIDNDVCLTDPFENRISISYNLQDPSRSKTVELITPPAPPGKKFLASGCLAGDFNGDGKVDVLAYFWGRTPVLFLNTGKGFTTQEVLDPPQRWYTQSITTADVDGDGSLDLVVANYFPDDAWILNEEPWNGRTEMNEGAGNALNGAYNKLLLGHPKQAKLFEEVPNFFDDKLGGAQWSIATAAVDVSGDLLPEVFFINDHGPDRFLYNRSTPGHPRFEMLKGQRQLFTPKSMTVGKDGFHGMGIDFADWNEDGRLDYFISNFTGKYVFYQANFAWMQTGDEKAYDKGIAPFESIAENIGFARTEQVPWDLRLMDLNNDGKWEIFQSTGFMLGKVSRTPEIHEASLWNDLVVKFPQIWHNFTYDDNISAGGPNSLFVLNSKNRYVDLGKELELQEKGVSRGATSSDIDGDGKIDFLVTQHNADPTLYRNRTPSGEFLGLALYTPYLSPSTDQVLIHEGLKPMPPELPSRRAIGARVFVTLPSGKRTVAVVDGGSGFGGKKSSTIHLGLGNIPKSTQLPITFEWKDTQGVFHSQSTTIGLGWHTVQLGGKNALAEVKQ